MHPDAVWGHFLQHLCISDEWSCNPAATPTGVISFDSGNWSMLFHADVARRAIVPPGQPELAVCKTKRSGSMFQNLTPEPGFRD